MMISWFTLVLVAISVSITSASMGFCDPNDCGVDQVCMLDNNVKHCILQNDVHNIALTQVMEKTWVENGRNFTLYRFHIINFGVKTLKHISIQTDSTLDPRDNTSIWNIEFNNGFFTLPFYSFGIPAGVDSMNMLNTFKVQERYIN
ncbi:hypothetical protein PPL_12557 [Heterostelium album PN500]|uniref:Carbohydrate binding domain-containing protein n=1 Tax=Heterostelium pallidum (strain ATCC 26659 / Pp 5 / PN500) TaxID=670386 RepID=D3BMY4_HETP5|nr:hypothetical protein PPL_12557 [Heterostelium album PN500]EFA77346.1 hypothetical protein PPL_12557 [Heterostelium album PN500]|eukprot:XP_020429475.1 hypothetical protein PPL_12557 [Heterostelium album PN500]